jgi:hypothetical protein
MRNNTAIATCLLSLVLFALCYQRHWMSLGQAIIFAGAVWDITGLWLARSLRATYNRKVSDLSPTPAMPPLARTIMKGSAVLIAVAVVVLVYNWNHAL